MRVLSAAVLFLAATANASGPPLHAPVVIDDGHPSRDFVSNESELNDKIIGAAGTVPNLSGFGQTNRCGIDLSGHVVLDTLGGNDLVVGKTTLGGHRQEGICVLHGAVIDLGAGDDTIKGISENGSNEGCRFDSGSIFGRDGSDHLVCKGGSHPPALYMDNFFINLDDHFKNNDSITVKGAAVVDDSGIFFGEGDDTLTVTQCLNIRGHTTIDMGDDDDKIIATVRSGTLYGGYGTDCYEPYQSGSYRIRCDAHTGYITVSTGVCGHSTVTLDSIERFGCGHVFIDFPTCPQHDEDGNTVGYSGTINFTRNEDEGSTSFVLTADSDKILHDAKDSVDKGLGFTFPRPETGGEVEEPKDPFAGLGEPTEKEEKPEDPFAKLRGGN